MMRWRLSLLIFSALALHGCLSADPDVQEEEEEESIRNMVDLYNQREGVTYLYKTLEDVPPVPLEDDEDPNKKAFIITETECLISENPDPSQCDVKQDGDVKICALDFGIEDPEEIICTGLYQNIRVRRAGKKKCKNVICKLLKAGKNSPILSIKFHGWG